jgi:UDP-N-acetyl-D-galactosamine dehydrogenase
VPALERSSGLTWREGFNVGYSPERINPGDPVRNLGNVKKIVAGDSPATADRLCAIYGSIVGAGIYRAPSIKVAEAAKGDARNSRVVELVAELRELASRLRSTIRSPTPTGSATSTASSSRRSTRSRAPTAS